MADIEKGQVAPTVTPTCGFFVSIQAIVNRFSVFNVVVGQQRRQLIGYTGALAEKQVFIPSNLRTSSWLRKWQKSAAKRPLLRSN
jgi:hypothetical protein